MSIERQHTSIFTSCKHPQKLTLELIPAKLAEIVDSVPGDSRGHAQEGVERLSIGGQEALAKCYEFIYGVPSKFEDVNYKGLLAICEGYLIGFIERQKSTSR